MKSKEEELEGMRAAAYIAQELDNGTPLDLLIKEFGDDRRSVNGRVAFINYHKWVAKDTHGSWHLTIKGRCWVRKLLGTFCCMTPIIRSLEEIAVVLNLSDRISLVAV